MLSGLVDPGLDSLEEPVLDRARLLGDVGDTCGSSTTESVPSMPCAFLMMTPSGILLIVAARALRGICSSVLLLGALLPCRLSAWLLRVVGHTSRTCERSLCSRCRSRGGY
jgi:hypothetical protein